MKYTLIYKRILACIPMFIMMIVIFGFSAGTGEESGSLSLEISRFASNALEKINIEISAEALQLPIRKLAHMSEYAVLAITVMWAFYGTAKRYGIAFILSVLYAVTDELHQLTVAGRCGSIIDVGIDTFGVILGLILYYIFHYFI